MNSRNSSFVSRCYKVVESLKTNQYKFILYALILLIGVPPFLRETDFSKLSFIVLLTVLLLACLNFLSRYKKFVIAALLIFILSFVTGWVSYIIDIRNLNIARSIFVLCFFLLVFYSLLEDIRFSKIISASVIYGSIAAYLLLGVIGGNIFVLIDLVYPESFNMTMNNQYASFFSFTTMTTVGYGSIYPIRPQAQAMSILLALSGQIYLTILIAILVGKYLIHSDKENE